MFTLQIVKKCNAWYQKCINCEWIKAKMACHSMLKVFFYFCNIYGEAILDLWLLLTEGCASTHWPVCPANQHFKFNIAYKSSQSLSNYQYIAFHFA